MSDQEMETDEAAPPLPIPFQLQFDKPIASQIKIAEWNPEKDLLAMVTEDSKVLLHRFNWQRLWTLSPGKAVTSLCWRPDGKAIALGLEDGSISLHDVENAKLLRSIKSHNVAIVCLNWEDDAQVKKDACSNNITYEDRTTRFFPPPPRVPRMPGLGSGDSGLMDEPEDSFHDLSNSSCQRFNILCSGDKDGSICFSIFGIFLIAKINIHQLAIHSSFLVEATYKLANASIHKRHRDVIVLVIGRLRGSRSIIEVTLSKNLSQLIVLCFGELVEDGTNTEAKSQWKFGGRAEVDKSLCSGNSSVGLHSLCFSTSIFLNRKNELHQVAQQASSIEDLNEVVRASLSVMTKQWSGAMMSFHDKFGSLSSLIIDHGLDSSSQDEFLSLLFGVRTSPPLHQFLVNSLGELGLKRVSKAVDGVGKELDLIVRESLQPAVEIIGFRVGELRGLSRWRARYQSVGLDEKLMDNATEKAGMLLVQVQRFIRVLAIVIYQFQNFLSWILKCIKILMSEPTDQIPPPNSELVVLFLKFFLGHDPVGQLLEVSDRDIEVDLDTMQRIEELVMFGGFSDSKFMQRSLAKEFIQLEGCFKEAFLMPFTTISKKIYCEDLLPLYSVSSTPTSTFLHAPTSVAYYKAVLDITSDYPISRDTLVDYVCFRIPDESLGMANCIGILKGFTNNCSATKKGVTSLGGVLLCIPEGYHCADLSWYKENQIILLLNEANCSQDPGKSLMMMVQTNDLPFVSFPSSAAKNFWKMQELEDSAVDLLLENGKVRYIPHAVTTPLAVSASRGVVCVFSSRKHALVYILDEDEDEVSDME